MLLLVPLLSPLAAPREPQATSRVPGSPADRASESPRLTFAALGDYGATTSGAFAVAALVRALDPTLVITLGDNNYPSGEADTIDENIGQHYGSFIHPYVGSYGPGALTNRFFPCLGNHDWGTDDAQPYLDYFTLPGNERYYDFRRGPVHFFALDSDPNEPDGRSRDSVQARWLEPRLEASDAPFRVVYLHHAPFSSSESHGSQLELQWPFREWGASIVLAGHDHLYERLNVGGLPYVVNGLGGRSLYDFDAPIPGSELRFNADHGALFVTADEEFARFRFLTQGDTVQDDFVLPRGGLDPGNPTLVPADGVWKYRDSGVDPGPGWTRHDFDDSAWPTGPAQFGYGEGDEATVVSYGGDADDRHVTTWFRTSFVLPHPQEFETLQLHLLHDDGAVVYLNGVEIVRSRMPAGAITAETLASSGAGGAQEATFYPFTVDADRLADLGLRAVSPGRNVLAVEIHQASRSSNDLSFAAELVAEHAGRRLVRRGSDWRYLDSGIEPPASWSAPAFDDTAWPIGPAQFGYGEGDEQTTVSTGPTTTWFRRTFTLTDAAEVRWLALRLLRDDGVIVYLNGHEAARLNLPRSGVSAGTFAAFEVGQENEQFFEPSSLDPRLLVDGVNTVAVELHQASASNDLSFDLELVAH